MKVLLVLILTALPLAALAEEPQPFVRGSWSELRQAHAGHPTIVHFWGVTCGPCLVELPQWAAFGTAHPTIDFVMVAADPVAISPASLAASLEGAGFNKIESWRFADPFAERLEYEIDPNWQGELPYTLLIGRDGAVQSILGGVDFSELARWSELQKQHAALVERRPSH